MLKLTAEGVDVAEIYNPPRVTAKASQFGLMPGFALDPMVNDPVDGKSWDFTDPEKRERARELRKETKPTLLIGSPMCKAFSRLQEMNYKHMHPDVVKEIVDAAEIHLKFCIELYWERLMDGLYFSHEHPDGTTSWNMREMINLIDQPGVFRV